MGAIKKLLAECKLPERDAHNGRLFVDLAESVHFHYREHRFVFSVDEFLHFAKVIEEGRKALEEEVKRGYKEFSGFPTKIIGGKQGDNLPFEKPTESAYFNNIFVIEEQADGVIDELHIHYRDYRLVINNKDTFLKFCETVEKAKKVYYG